jgi:hypothetical protein
VSVQPDLGERKENYTVINSFSAIASKTKRRTNRAEWSVTWKVAIYQSSHLPPSTPDDLIL